VKIMNNMATRREDKPSRAGTFITSLAAIALSFTAVLVLSGLSEWLTVVTR